MLNALVTFRGAGAGWLCRHLGVAEVWGQKQAKCHDVVVMPDGSHVDQPTTSSSGAQQYRLARTSMWHNMAWCGRVAQGSALRGLTWHNKAGPGMARLGMARLRTFDLAHLGLTRPGLARLGPSRLSSARLSLARSGSARLGSGGVARRGVAWCNLTVAVTRAVSAVSQAFPAKITGVKWGLTGTSRATTAGMTARVLAVVWMVKYR